MTGPRRSVVAIGGGHGLAMSLEALVPWFDDVTAVVSVADDGGSSGRLRSELGGPAPGDMRRCIEALTPPGIARDALGHRFAVGELEGHPAGNVLLAAMLQVADDPVAALDTLATMLGARGRVLPATIDPVDLVARAGTREIRGQVAISGSSDITELGTDPRDPPIPDAVEAVIAGADLVLLGPGSLYTSVLAAAVPGVRRAIAASSALLVHVTNLAPEAGETEGLSLADHVAAVLRHGLVPDVVIVDEGARDDAADLPVKAVRAAIAGADGRLHEPEVLGRVVSELVHTVRA